MEDFFAHSTVLPLTVVSDGLGCFEVAASLGACHDRTVTGGKARVELEQSRCVNKLISNIKTALGDTYHSVKSTTCTRFSVAWSTRWWWRRRR